LPLRLGSCLLPHILILLSRFLTAARQNFQHVDLMAFKKPYYDDTRNDCLLQRSMG
jgi:hypothetical protein